MLPAGSKGAVEPLIIKQAYWVARELAPAAIKVPFLEGDANSKVRMDPSPQSRDEERNCGWNVVLRSRFDITIHNPVLSSSHLLCGKLNARLTPISAPYEVGSMVSMRMVLLSISSLPVTFTRLPTYGLALATSSSL